MSSGDWQDERPEPLTVDGARANRISMRTASETPAGRVQFFENYLSDRLDYVRAEEKRIDALRARVYALEEEAHVRKAALLAEARSAADALIRGAEEQAAKMLAAGETQAHTMRSLALPPPPRPGGGELVADVIKDTLQHGITKAAEFLIRSVEVNPQSAGDVVRGTARFVSAVMPGAGGAAGESQSAEGETAADSLDRITMGDFNEAVAAISEARRQAVIAKHSWQAGDYDSMTLAFIKDMVRAYLDEEKSPE